MFYYKKWYKFGWLNFILGVIYLVGWVDLLKKLYSLNKDLLIYALILMTLSALITVTKGEKEIKITESEYENQN